jgi:hypothetical protein
MHTVWDLLLDKEFIEGSTNRLAIRCSDGIERVFFLCIITYSADYPEKSHINQVVTAATLIQDKGTIIYNQEPWGCPLPVVLNQKEQDTWRGYPVRCSKT